MKILHTADWHLGKRLDHFSRMEEQIQVMEEIVQIADQQQVDVVIVAGDLFDTFNPSVDAIELLYRTLKRLTNEGKRPVIAIAGNHDSPDRIDAPDPLARECGILMIGHPDAIIQNLQLEHFEVQNSAPGFFELLLPKYSYPLRIVHTPYANEIRLKQYLGESNKETALNEALKQRWFDIAEQYCDAKGVNVLTAHLYMMKRGGERPEEPEGEKPIMIGNADMIYTDCIPEQMQYTALGHLHGYRNIESAEKPIVYSSSPLCYSFSEAGQTKYVAIVELMPGQVAKVERIALSAGRPLYRKTFQEVDAAVEWLAENEYALVELTIETDTFLTAEDRKRIYQTHDGIIHLIPKMRQMQAEETSEVQINLNQDMEDLFVDFFKSANKGQEPNEEIMQLFQEILNLNK